MFRTSGKQVQSPANIEELDETSSDKIEFTVNDDNSSQKSLSDSDVQRICSGIHYESTKFTVDDITDSSREGTDETDQIRRLDKGQRRSGMLLPMKSLYPIVSDEFLGFAEKHDKKESSEKDDDEYDEGDIRILDQQGQLSGLYELTKRYALRQRNSGTNTTINAPPYELSGHLEDIESGGSKNGEDYDPSQRKRQRRRCMCNQKFKVHLDFMKELLEPHRKGLRKTFKITISYVMLPSIIIACILFYGFNNPPNGTALVPCQESTANINSFQEIGTITDSNETDRTSLQTDKSPKSLFLQPLKSFESSSHVPPVSITPSQTVSEKTNSTMCFSEEESQKQASTSWWFLFVLRQAVTFCLAVLMQLLFVDFLMLRTRYSQKLLGTRLTLALGQSKGWPCVLFLWAIIDLFLLFGDNPFARHWLYYQNYVDLFNSKNPSGNVLDNSYYKKAIFFAIGLSPTVTLKRTIMANFVGRRVVVNYRRDLSKLIKKLLIVGDVAELSNMKSKNQSGKKAIFQRLTSVARIAVDKLERDNDVEDNSEIDLRPEEARPRELFIKRPKVMTSTFRRINSSEFLATSTIYDRLDEWEEPALQDEDQKITTQDILHFRRAVEFISGTHPFSPAFGKAGTREECAIASQKIFDNLVEKKSHVLDFNVLSELGKNPDGTKNRKMMLELVKLFRPNRGNEISKLEFVKSIDSVYKTLRLVLANINSASQIDRAYRKIANIVFSVVVTLIGISFFGFDVEKLVLGIAGVLLSFSFLIGSASSKYFEGILLILFRKPYNIGDKVCILDPNAPVDDIGPPSGGWIVENVDLYTTTVRLGTTREYATFANSSLANSRILNLKRSEQPNIYMYLKFTMDITREQVDEFRRRIVEYIKDRPREWIKLVSLRCTHFELEQQYLKFALIIQHREPWQSYGTIQVSKSHVYIHALQLQKELGLNYTAPKVPVHLTRDPRHMLAGKITDENGDDNREGATNSYTSFSSDNSWRQVARNKLSPLEEEQAQMEEVSRTLSETRKKPTRQVSFRDLPLEEEQVQMVEASSSPLNTRKTFTRRAAVSALPLDEEQIQMAKAVSRYELPPNNSPLEEEEAQISELLSSPFSTSNLSTHRVALSDSPSEEEQAQMAELLSSPFNIRNISTHRVASSDSPLAKEQVQMAEASSTALNTGATSATDGSLVRRKGGQRGSQRSFKDDSNERQMFFVEESDVTVSGRRLMFEKKASNGEEKNKNM